MGEFEGVSRIVRTELNQPPERHPKLERTDKDRRQRQGQQEHEHEPHDSVELHDEAQDTQSKKAPKNPPKDRKLDISA